MPAILSVVYIFWICFNYTPTFSQNESKNAPCVTKIDTKKNALFDPKYTIRGNTVQRVEESMGIQYILLYWVS